MQVLVIKLIFKTKITEVEMSLITNIVKIHHDHHHTKYI